MIKEHEYIIKNLERYIIYAEQEKVKLKEYPGDIGYNRTYSFYIGKASAMLAMAKFFNVDIPEEIDIRGKALNH